MTKQQITKHLNIIQDCINDIRLGWQVEMNIQVLKKFKEEEK